MNFNLITLTLICIAFWSCSSEISSDHVLVTQRVLHQNVVSTTSYDDVFFSQLSSMDSFNELIVASDNQSNIVILNRELELIRHTNIRGGGPGEAVSIMGLTFGQDGIMFYNHEKSVITKVNSEFTLLGEVQTHAICCFSFIYSDYTILSAVNRSNSLFSKITFDRNQSGNSVYEEFNSNFTFDYAQSDINHNQHQILQIDDKIILVGVSHPTLYLFDSNSLELIDKHQYGHFDFLNTSIAFANKIHTDANKPRQIALIVRQSRIYDNYIFLLINTRDGDSLSTNNLLVFELTDQSVQARSVIELAGQDSPKVFRDFVVLPNNRIVAYGLDGSFYDFNFEM